MRRHYKKKSMRKIVGACLVAALLLTMLLPIYALADVTQQEAVQGEENVNAVSDAVDSGEGSADETNKSNNDKDSNSETDNNSQNENSENENSENGNSENGDSEQENGSDNIGDGKNESGSSEDNSNKNNEDNLINGEEGDAADELQNEENPTEEDVLENADAIDFDIQTVAIADTVETDGRFTLNVTDAQGNAITAQQLAQNGYTITWTKNGAEVTRRKVTLNIYNMDENFGWVNVSYDGGSGATYTVTVSKNGVAAGKASSTVAWYDNLINSSFEEPQFAQSDSYGWLGIKQLPQDFVPGWATTASDGLIEIGNVTITDIYGNIGTEQWYNCSTAPLGNQIAEINCTTTGALYQNVLTKPGATMYWELSHRGRDGTDTMALVIAPYHLVKGLSGQSELEAFIKARIGNAMSAPNGYTGDDGVYIKTMSDGQSWQTYKGSITVPGDSYVTSFFFVAIDTATGDKSAGNLLDTVYFSEEIPPPINETGTITIEKKVYGLDLSTARDNLTQSFISYNKDGQVTQVTYEPRTGRLSMTTKATNT